MLSDVEVLSSLERVSGDSQLRLHSNKLGSFRKVTAVNSSKDEIFSTTR